MKIKQLFFILVITIFVIGGNMGFKLGDRLMDFVNGNLTNPIDQELLRRDLNTAGYVADTMMGWIPISGDNPTFKTIRVQNGIFDIAPLNSSTFKTASTQGMTSGGEVVVFDGSSIFDENSLIVPYNTPVTKFHINPSFSLRDTGFGLGAISVGWDESLATTVSVMWYAKSDDSFLGVTNPMKSTFFNMTTPLMLPYDTIVTTFSLNPSQVYFTIQVTQSSGVDKNMTSRVVFYRLR